MLQNLEKHFVKHYKRIEEDLKQFKDFSPAMMKIISFNLNKLKNDLKNEDENETITDKWEETRTD